MNLEMSAWPVASIVSGFLIVLSGSLVVLAYRASRPKPMLARRPETNSSDKRTPVEGVAVPNRDVRRGPGQVDRGGWPAVREVGHQPPFWASWPITPGSAALARISGPGLAATGGRADETPLLPVF